jgi:prepilin-type N-terminal cleavage/methylation domain-containing protein
MKQKLKSMRGFTLVEIMVVITIVGIILAVATVSFSAARENSNIKAETAQVNQFKLNLQLYRELNKTFPPGASGVYTDSCSKCQLTGDVTTAEMNQAIALWKSVADALTPKFTPVAKYTDKWGMPYAYDNNYNVSGSTNYTFLCSMGPDKILSTGSQDLDVGTFDVKGDDICMFLK